VKIRLTIETTKEIGTKERGAGEEEWKTSKDEKKKTLEKIR